MPKHDIIVIGASAGGVEALQMLVRALPADLPAAVFVVLHTYPRTRSLLPEILTRAGPLPAAHPEHGQLIQLGMIYVALPDQHLLIERGHIHLSMGPQEQHQRPCINVTFRSAAIAYGERVVGVILTGHLDDGTAGLWEIKRRGGMAVVQNPEGALVPSMPLNALREVPVDYTMNLEQMAPLLSRLARGEGEQERSEVGKNDIEPALTDLTCPECRGTIWEVSNGNTTEYRCRVGHTYSVRAMLTEHFATQERTLYSAIVALKEGASLASRLADKIQPEMCERLKEQAQLLGSQAETLDRILRERRSFTLD